MSILLDAIVIFTFILSCFLCYKRGFLRSILGVAGNLLSLFGALYLSRHMGKWIFNAFFRQNLINDIQYQLATGTGNSEFVKITYQFTDKIPAFVSNALFGKPASHMAREILSQETMQNTAQTLTDKLIAPIMIFIICCISFFILYISFRLLIRLLLKFTGAIQNIPVIGNINGFLGGVIGIINGVIALFVLGAAAYFLIFFTSNSLSWMNESIIDNTHLFFVFYKLNFLHML